MSGGQHRVYVDERRRAAKVKRFNVDEPFGSGSPMGSPHCRNKAAYTGRETSPFSEIFSD
jgi:hypothetical protein